MRQTGKQSLNERLKEQLTIISNSIKKNITEFSWSTLCLAAIIWPQFVGFNLAFISASTLCILIQTTVQWNQSSSESNKVTLLQFMRELIFASGRAPTLIAISSLMCILSTVAPINLYFNNAMQAALNGGSFITYQEAAFAMLLWQTGFWAIRNIFAKVESQNNGTIDGSLIMSLFTKKRNNAYEREDKTFKTTHADNIKNISRVDDITSNVYYFGQTILCAVLALISSVISVIQYPLPAALNTIKNNLIKRFFALSVFINLTSVWFSRVWVQETFTAQRNEQQSIGEQLKAETDNVNLPSKYLFYRVILNWRRAFQDMFQGLPKAINDNNNLAVLMIVMAVSPSFPLGAGSLITVAQVISLGSAMKAMLMESLVISRNNASWTQANATFDTISGSKGNGIAAFELSEIAHYYKSLEESQFTRPNWMRDLADSLTAMTAILSGTQLLCSHIGVTFLELGLSTTVLSTALGASVLYGLLVLVQNQTFTNGMIADSQEGSDEYKAYIANAIHVKRFGNVFCNTMVTLLVSRLLCMFAPFFGESVMTVLSFGLTTSFWPQVIISALTVNLTMTLFVTPNLVPREIEEQTFLQSAYSSFASLLSTVQSFSNYCVVENPWKAEPSGNIKQQNGVPADKNNTNNRSWLNIFNQNNQNPRNWLAGIFNFG